MVRNARGYSPAVTTAPVSTMFSSAGTVAEALGPTFEPRPQQAEMAEAVARAFEARSVLLVEAGTGIGKSFAYLLPAIRRLVASEGAERVVIATNTIALQEQLMAKDIPVLLRALPEAERDLVRPELVKGRGNYLSVRRLKLASTRQDRLFADPAAKRSLHAIEDWAYTTTDGTLSTLPQLERPGVWDRAQSDAGNCMGRRCPTYEQCFYQNARRRMDRANLLVCNHALYFSDLALRRSGAGFLPQYDHVVLDEAHHVEDVASDHFGLSLAEGRVRHLLSALHQGKRQRGFLASVLAPADAAATVDRAVALCDAASRASDSFFESLVDLARGEIGAVRIREPDAVANVLTPACRDLALVLRRLREALDRDEDRYELNAYALRAAAIADEAEALVSQQMEGCAYWVETGAGDGPGRGLRVTLACSPIDVAPVLGRTLFGQKWSVVLTSATLTTSRASFDHARARLGCENAETLALGSPFDHARQAELHVHPRMPDPRSDRYEPSLAEHILRHLEATDGGAFVLFTSFRTMHRLADLLRTEIGGRLAMPLWVQGRDGSRAHILEKFREDERSVLFGTSSFWQGVDVQGRGLRNVIITRLPFDPPDRPLTQARSELIAERGGDPFMDDSLPRAVIRFKQGFGRLIRSSGDSGRVVVLDPRLVKSGYGRVFLSALPPGVRTFVDGEELPPSAD